MADKTNSNSKKIPVVAIVGATASGKTSLAIEICKKLYGEVVSADSMQVYKGMDIATAKPTKAECAGVLHHLIGFVPVDQNYSVKQYVEDATPILKDIYARGKLPVVCGGTGLYVDSLLKGMKFEDEPEDYSVREKLRVRKDHEGIEPLYNELKTIDPEYAETVHMNNVKRVLRALEIYYLTGEKPSVRRERQASAESPFDPVYISIEYNDRGILYERIDKRVDKMVESGLIEEAREFISLNGTSTASAAIGYKELEPYLKGEESLIEALDALRLSTRRYAKRQLTWYRNRNDINRIVVDTLRYGETPIGEAMKIILGSGKFKKLFPLSDSKKSPFDA